MKYASPLVILGLITFIGCQKPETAEVTEDTLNFSDSVVEIDTLAATLGWVETMQSPSGLMESAEGTEFVSLYDNALSAILLVKTGREDRARHIFDYYLMRMETEFQSTGGGFYQFRNLSGTDGSRIWIGDNAWLLIALRHYREASGDSRYDVMIDALDSWLRSMQDSDGGLLSGKNADGSLIVKVTEGMISAYLAVAGYDSFHKDLEAYLKTNRWDPDLSLFLAEEAGSPYANALDLHSLSALIWPNSATTFLTEASLFRTEQLHTVNKSLISGYCFDRDLDVIWLEGTAQMALAKRVSGMYGEYESTVRNLEASMVGSLSHPNKLGLPYSTNPGSSYGAVMLWEHAHLQPCLSATAWYLFARLGINPFELTDPEKPDTAPLS